MSSTSSAMRTTSKLRPAADALREPGVNRIGVVDEENEVVQDSRSAKRVLDGRRKVVAEQGRGVLGVLVVVLDDPEAAGRIGKVDVAEGLRRGDARGRGDDPDVVEGLGIAHRRRDGRAAGMDVDVGGDQDHHRGARGHALCVGVDGGKLRPVAGVVVDVPQVRGGLDVDRHLADTRVVGALAAVGVVAVEGDQRRLEDAAHLDHVRARPHGHGRSLKVRHGGAHSHVVEGVRVRVDDRDSRKLRVIVVQDGLGHEEAARAGHPDRPRHLINAVAHGTLRVGHVLLALVDARARVEDREDAEHRDREQQHDDDHLDEREAGGGGAAGPHGSTTEKFVPGLGFDRIPETRAVRAPIPR